MKSNYLMVIISAANNNAWTDILLVVHKCSIISFIFFYYDRTVLPTRHSYVFKSNWCYWFEKLVIGNNRFKGKSFLFCKSKQFFFQFIRIIIEVLKNPYLVSCCLVTVANCLLQFFLIKYQIPNLYSLVLLIRNKTKKKHVENMVIHILLDYQIQLQTIEFFFIFFMWLWLALFTNMMSWSSKCLYLYIIRTTNYLILSRWGIKYSNLLFQLINCWISFDLVYEKTVDNATAIHNKLIMCVEREKEKIKSEFVLDLFFRYF